MRLKPLAIPFRIRWAVVAILVLLAIGPGYFTVQDYLTPTRAIFQVPDWGWSQSGEWDYSVLVASNTIYGSRKVGPGQEYFSSLVERIEAQFSYTLVLDAPARIDGWYEVTAKLAAGNVYQERTFLTPKTSFSRINASRFDIELEFPVDRSAYRARLEEVAEEASLDMPGTAEIVYTAHVEVSAAREGAGIRRVMEPTLVVPLGDTPSFEISGNRQIANSGVLRLPEEVTRSGLGRQGGISMVVAGSLVLLVVMVALATSSRPRNAKASGDSVARPVQRFKRRYKNRIAVGLALESELPGDQTVPINAMPDLARISEELLKPIVYVELLHPESEHVFYVVDGPIRYEFRLKGELAVDVDCGEVSSDDSFLEGSDRRNPEHVLNPETLPSTEITGE